MLSFIENCFKHGLKENDKIKINMSFEMVNKDYLEFRLSNNFNPKTKHSHPNGIGNENSERRLKLLFANNFILENKIENDTYNLLLKIPV